MQAEVDLADARRVTPTGTRREGRRGVWVRSLWGDFRIERAYYTRTEGGDGYAPADGMMGLWGAYTPAMARTLSKLAAQLPFEAAADLLREATTAAVNGRQFHRLTTETATAMRRWTARLKPSTAIHDTMYISFDGTGVPMRRECLVGRKGRGPDGQSRTREMRLGCVFTQTTVDDEGQPVRDADSTTYIAGLASSRVFGRAVKKEAIRRGMKNARRVVVLTDGAKWCETAAAMNFPGHLHILDFYHAAQHVRDLSVALYADGRDATVHFRLWRRALLRGKAAELLAAASDQLTKAHDPDAAQREINYLTHNLSRMQYASYRQQGLFIGSGVIEAGCKTVVAQRAKLSGMFWGVQGVEDVLTLRCQLLGGQIDLFWDDAFAGQATG